MKQEVHTCDRCHKTFNTPEYSIGNIDHYYINGDLILEDFELCFTCRESFEKWLNEINSKVE